MSRAAPNASFLLYPSDKGTVLSMGRDRRIFNAVFRNGAFTFFSAVRVQVLMIVLQAIYTICTSLVSPFRFPCCWRTRSFCHQS
jgi:hypothetical protein